MLLKALQSHLLVPCCWQVLLRGHRGGSDSGSAVTQCVSTSTTGHHCCTDPKSIATSEPGQSLAGRKEV